MTANAGWLTVGGGAVVTLLGAALGAVGAYSAFVNPFQDKVTGYEGYPALFGGACLSTTSAAVIVVGVVRVLRARRAAPTNGEGRRT